MIILPKAIYRFSVIAIKLPMTLFFLTELEQKFSNLYKNIKDPKTNSQGILREKNGAGGINISDFRLYYRL